MLFICYLLFALGITGFLAMTFLFPLVAIAGRLIGIEGEFAVTPEGEENQPESLSILIPAHNEEQTLGETLNSINRAIERAQQKGFFKNIRVVVGIDGCTDQTESVAHRYGALTKRNAESIGKWGTLMTLLYESTSFEWVAFVDAGTVWPENLLEKVGKRAVSSMVTGIAPTYRNPHGGTLEVILWSIESFIKSLEALVRGPVSIHGATVFYRTDELSHALYGLDQIVWLNDDVVIPLVLRTAYPGKRIEYLKNTVVSDGKPVRGRSHSDFNRRRRMTFGNLQWMTRLMGLVWRDNPLAFVLALRRIARVFWAYYVFAIAFAILIWILHSISIEWLELPLFFVGLLTIVLGPLFTKYRGAALASILAPIWLLKVRFSEEDGDQEVSWR